MTRRQAIVALALGCVAAASAAAAHQLLVFASVQGDDVVVETKFSTGKRPKVGTVKVSDGADKVFLSLPIGANGVTRFPLADTPGAAESGLMIEVDLGSGHQDYWILTPQDIAAQSAK